MDVGTLYFLNGSSGTRRYNPRDFSSMPTVSGAPYSDFFTGLFARAGWTSYHTDGFPTYSNIKVTQDAVTITTYTVSSIGNSALFDEIKIVKTPLNIIFSEE